TTLAGAATSPTTLGGVAARSITVTLSGGAPGTTFAPPVLSSSTTLLSTATTANWAVAHEAHSNEPAEPASKRVSIEVSLAGACMDDVVCDRGVRVAAGPRRHYRAGRGHCEGGRDNR